ncbi:uncharacterized protein [Elaeis guineensis]|uniref:Uncharacterized protein LOC105040084 n=1 Tax=Elaeis guineensis var. tenera TaxID=51953 RepID=A0A6I9QT89_ELAGV|nr:uncharacterized protein LOC105040084 [Elaeis guineensis]
MAESSRELLDQPSRPSVLETLLLGSTDSAPKIPRNNAQVEGNEEGMPLTTAVPKSQVLGKVKDFLGNMAKANEKLELDAQKNSRADYDIEVLSGNEKEYIEMDLLLGVADLHTADAVAAAESTVGGFRPTMHSASSSSSETEDDTDDDNNDSGIEDTTTCKLDKLKKSNPENDESLHKNKPNKRPKIVVLD